MSEKLKLAYKIQGKSLKLEKITIKQIREIGTLIDELQIESDSSVATVLQNLDGERAKGVMKIAFRKNLKEVEAIDWDDVEIDEVAEIIDNFFGLNGKLKERLTNTFFSFPISSEAIPQTP